MTLGYGDLKKGLAIELDGEPYSVVGYERSKMQQRAPVMKIRFKSLRTGRVVDRSFNGYDVKLTPAAVERRGTQFLYDDNDLYYFMDTETFEQFPLPRGSIEDSIPYLVEQIEVDLILYDGNPIAIDLPTTVDLKVGQTDPGLRGDTAQGGTKRATMETGLIVQVPLFVEEGESLRIDTRSGELPGQGVRCLSVPSQR